jgi:hypothetical protein
MYPQPPPVLPITGPGLLGIALVGGALMIGGLVMLRLAYFIRRRRNSRGATAVWRAP